MTLRINRRAAEDADPTRDYLERLLKLIPAEVVALYMTGKQIILGDHPPVGGGPLETGDRAYWITWTLLCLVAIVLVRAYATSGSGKPVQWNAVGIAAVSYLIWVYSMGDVFTYWSMWDGRVSALLMVGWTFIVPFFYRGD